MSICKSLTFFLAVVRLYSCSYRPAQPMFVKKSELSKLRNIGAVSEAWLNEVGIFTRADLEEAGAVEAYRRVRARGHNASLNLVYAVQGAIMDLHWTDLPFELKEQLKRECSGY